MKKIWWRDTDAVPEPDWAKRIERLTARAMELEAGLLAGVPEAMARLEADLAGRIDGFVCAFRRFGDFLTIEMEQSHDRFEERPWRVVETVNLGKVHTIRFEPGEPVACDRVGYWRQADAMEPPACDDDACDDDACIIAPDIVERRRRRLIETLDTSGAVQHLYDASAFRPYGEQADLYGDTVLHTTAGLPRADQDERIHFAGAGVTVHVPFGLGRRAYLGMLAEIARGAPTRIDLHFEASS